MERLAQYSITWYVVPLSNATRQGWYGANGPHPEGTILPGQEKNERIVMHRLFCHPDGLGDIQKQQAKRKRVLNDFDRCMGEVVSKLFPRFRL
jgi:hypothetical protein